MRCLYREKFHIYDKYMEIDIYPVYIDGNKRQRRKNYRETSETQKALNAKNAGRRFVWLVNGNFTESDMAFHLTYNEERKPQNDEEAIKQLRNYIRRLKRLYKKRGFQEFKYIAVTEKGTKKGRYHHHMIISGGVPINELAKIWGNGYTKAQPLQFDKMGVENLATYMMKKTIGEQRYIASRNLKKPIERERTGVISQKRVLDIAKQNTDGLRTIRQFYKDYEMAELQLENYNIEQIKSRINDGNGGGYITIKLYKAV